MMPYKLSHPAMVNSSCSYLTVGAFVASLFAGVSRFASFSENRKVASKMQPRV